MSKTSTDPVVQLALAVEKCLTDLAQAVKRFAVESVNLTKRSRDQRPAAKQIVHNRVRVSIPLAPNAETRDVSWSQADGVWGYKFGCDGVSKVTDAGEFLGLSRQAVYRLVQAGKIRKGHGGKICNRSLTAFIHGLEE